MGYSPRGHKEARLKRLSTYACMGVESGAGCGARFLLLGGPGKTSEQRSAGVRRGGAWGGDRAAGAERAGAETQEMGQKAGRECHVTRARVDVGSDSAQSPEATAGFGAEPPPDHSESVGANGQRLRVGAEGVHDGGAAKTAGCRGGREAAGAVPRLASLGCQLKSRLRDLRFSHKDDKRQVQVPEPHLSPGVSSLSPARH